MASAHSRNQAGQRHDLVQHLRGVADRAEAFADAFGGGDLARAAGLYHDLGKFHPEFQDYLRYCETHPGERGPRVDHKAAGGEYAQRISGPLRLLIMAHHGGLRAPAEVDAKLTINSSTHGVASPLDDGVSHTESDAAPGGA
jgi:CRISPR-associated endonuclease/helicase Cas3